MAGYDVAPAGDFNGDMIDDYLIGAFGGRRSIDYPGEAYIILSDDTPVPIDFISNKRHGNVNEWLKYKGIFQDLNGAQDIDRVQIVIGKHSSDGKGLNSIYIPGENAIYLRNSTGSGWVGPCTPGANGVLDNQSIIINCKLSTVTMFNEQSIKVNWRLKWKITPTTSINFDVFLRAIDLSKDDLGFVYFGNWTLIP